MTERRTSYTAGTGLVTEKGEYRLFNRFDSDEDIRKYMQDRYGATDIEIVYTGGGKLAGPIGATEGNRAYDTCELPEEENHAG